MVVDIRVLIVLIFIGVLFLSYFFRLKLNIIVNVFVGDEVLEKVGCYYGWICWVLKKLFF